MPASDSCGRQAAKDGKNQPLAVWCCNATFRSRGNRAHGALLQVGKQIIVGAVHDRERQLRPSGRQELIEPLTPLNVAEFGLVVNRLEAIYDLAKNISSYFGIICSRMRLCFIPLESGRRYRTREHSLTERYATKRCRVEATKRMKRIAFDFSSLDCFIQESKIKCCVVANQYCSAAVVFSHRGTYRSENSL